MRTPPFLFGLLAAVVLSTTAQGQPYTVKLKLHPDPGKLVVVRSTSKDEGFMRFLDPDGKVLFEEKPNGKEFLYTDTTLELKDGTPTRYKLVYEKASEAKNGEKPKPKSYEGRTLLFEKHEGKFRVGVVGKPPLASEDHDKLTRDANKPSSEDALLNALVTGKAVKVGDSWKIDPKTQAAAMPEGKFDLERSSGEAKLVGVKKRGNSTVGVFEVKLRLLITGLEDFVAFDPPAEFDLSGTVEIAIDGSSTARTLVLDETFKGKGALAKGKGTAEIDGSSRDRREVSQEKDDPRGKEAPVVQFPSGKAEWEATTHKAGKFTVSFPATPSETSKKDAAGNTTTTLTASLEKGNIAYLAVVTDFVNDISKVDPNTILDNVAKSVAKTSKSKKEISINGFPGLEIEHETEQGGKKVVMTQRIYVVKGRLYQLLAIAEVGTRDKLEAETFFKSFKIQEKADQKDQ